MHNRETKAGSFRTIFEISVLKLAFRLTSRPPPSLNAISIAGYTAIQSIALKIV
jgi:hypothetical protein